MGYYTTSPVLSLVLTLFNVRLGWWLGNPGTAGQDTYRRASPLLSVTPVVQEALGLTDDTSAYVYLTDGGHFENLALYEMVLRRCHLIVLSDGTGDGKYRVRRPRQRRAQDPHRPRRPHRVRRGAHLRRRRPRRGAAATGPSGASATRRWTRATWCATGCSSTSSPRSTASSRATWCSTRWRTPTSRTSPPATSSSTSRSSRATARSAGTS